MFKKKRGLYSDVNDVSKICTTCKYASELQSADELMCSKKGLVDPMHTCRHYDYNRLMKREFLSTPTTHDKYKPEDFEI